MKGNTRPTALTGTSSEVALLGPGFAVGGGGQGRGFFSMKGRSIGTDDNCEVTGKTRKACKTRVRWCSGVLRPPRMKVPVHPHHPGKLPWGGGGGQGPQTRAVQGQSPRAPGTTMAKSLVMTSQLLLVTHEQPTGGWWHPPSTKAGIKKSVE